MKKVKLKPLYKLDTKGKTRIWKVHTEGSVIVSQHGLLDGKLITTRVDAKPKNVGRANETTAEEQAVLEAKSLWTNKLVKYSEVKPTDADDNKTLTPMLAKKFSDQELDFPIDIQPKLDGYRCLVKVHKEEVTLISRSGKPFSFPVIEEEVRTLNLENTYLDGELYIHGKSFQQVSKAIKNNHKDVTLHLYDLIDLDSKEDTWKERESKLLKLLDNSSLKKVKLVKTKTVRSVSHIEQKHEHYTSKGYEGAILRDRKGKYKFNGRSSDLLKVKMREDAEFLVVDVDMAEKGRAKGGAIFVCQNDISEETFRCSMKKESKDQETFKLRKEQYRNKDKYIGKILTVEFFGRSDTGIPREPVAKAFRDPIDNEIRNRKTL